jgi:hypothetical protein
MKKDYNLREERLAIKSWMLQTQLIRQEVLRVTQAYYKRQGIKKHADVIVSAKRRIEDIKIELNEALNRIPRGGNIAQKAIRATEKDRLRKEYALKIANVRVEVEGGSIETDKNGKVSVLKDYTRVRKGTKHYKTNYNGFTSSTVQFTEKTRNMNQSVGKITADRVSSENANNFIYSGDTISPEMEKVLSDVMIRFSGMFCLHRWHTDKQGFYLMVEIATLEALGAF